MGQNRFKMERQARETLFLNRQGLREVLQERLGSRVNCKVWGWEQTGKRANVDNQTLSGLLGLDGSVDQWDGQLGHFDQERVIDGEDVFELVVWRFLEQNRTRVRPTNVVDQNRHRQLLNRLVQRSVQLWGVFGAVGSNNSGLHFVLGLDLGGDLLEFGLGSRHKHHVQASRCKLFGKLLANSLGSSRDNGPRTFLGSKLAVVDRRKEEQVDNQRQKAVDFCRDLENTNGSGRVKQAGKQFAVE
ncbi:hypothetical protein OGAPHI_002481 [Ogataea philodendri]|uniref:Uncharacterized protein n=1 Tax=Ogataea philodendri TaxID=1378263 RepID=A0A9P8PCE9_9ASCO|nr:uncharacterized protein OGAPHI_002481 [Ogataea philodendri]KAH3668727.1 hypothetical protein OGAPHI_002481 [Ogataea philodendri]